jgi:hypothetical protein
MIELLLLILLAVVILGAIYWVATYFGAPQPIAVGLVIVLAIIVALALLGDSSAKLD